MRVYVPATASDLAHVQPKGRIDLPGHRYGIALAKPLVTRLSPDEVEELEWEAFATAAAASAQLVTAVPAAAPIRVVLSLDVPEAAIDETQQLPDGGLCRVQIADFAGAKLAAIHVDEPAAAPLIQNLRGTPDSESALAAVLEADMLWYDPAEAAQIPIPG